jgi:hypothetical protein
MKQSPCIVNAYLGAPCFGGGKLLCYLPHSRLLIDLNIVVYTVASISPGLYYVPGGDGSDPCTCSTVTYSVVAACALCQGGLAGK